MTDNEKLEKIIEDDRSCTYFCEQCPIGDLCISTNRTKLAELMLERNKLKAGLEKLKEENGKSLNDYARESHEANKEWWEDLHIGEPIARNKGELLMLIVSEVAEAMEGVRKNINDDHLPQYKMEQVELVDCLIRIFDYCGAHGFRIEEIYQAKMEYNAHRADHKPENRTQKNGKKF